MADQLTARRPEGASDELVEAVGRASEGLEYVERARGHLYSFHQLMGRADLTMGEAAELLEDAGARNSAERLRRQVIGRNVIDGRWSFQVVEEFDDLYYEEVRTLIRGLDDDHMGGTPHVHESEMKARRRSHGVAGHESRPPAAHDPRVDTQPEARPDRERTVEARG